MNEIRLVLPFPPSVNRLWRTNGAGGMHRSKKYTDWRKQASWAVAGQLKGKSISGRYELEIVAVRPDKRRRDLGNLEKAVSDLLQEESVIEDDCLCERIELRWAPSGPECLIYVRKYDDGETIRL